MPEPLVLRDQPVPDVLVLIRLGSKTLADDHLRRSCELCHGRWGFWGFSVFEVPGGDYGALVQARPFVAHRRLLFVADGPDLVSAGFSVLPTEEAPHWSVVLSEPTPLQFARVRRHFRGPVENPAWAGHRPPVD